MRSNLDGRQVRHFFRNGDDTCNCPRRLLTVVSAMTVDDTNVHKPMMYWMSVEGNLYVTDIHGCTCNEVLNWDVNEETSSLTVDKINIYWSSVAEDRIYFLRKERLDPFARTGNASEVRSFYLPSVRSITALGESLQSYPNASCLIPRRDQYKIVVNKTTSNSIVVKLPEPIVEHGCERYNLPSTLYTIRVSRCLDAKDANGTKECKRTREETMVRTYERRHEIRNLKTFTMYTLRLALTNHYAKTFDRANVNFGPAVTLMTGPGTPSAPKNVTVQVLTPVLAAVYWSPPETLNSATVHYEIHWRSIGMMNGVRQKGEQLIKMEPERTADRRFFTTLQPLLPGQDYLVYVRVYPANYSNSYNESVSKTIRMYPEPNNLTVSGATVDSLNISWVPSNLTSFHALQYTDVAVEHWRTANDVASAANNVTYRIKGLQPRTLYKFRLLLRYPAYKEDFVWSPDARFTFQTLGKNALGCRSLSLSRRYPQPRYSRILRANETTSSQFSVRELGEEFGRSSKPVSESPLSS